MRKYFMIGTVMAAMVLTVGCGNGKKEEATTAAATTVAETTVQETTVEETTTVAETTAVVNSLYEQHFWIINGEGNRDGVL